MVTKGNKSSKVTGKVSKQPVKNVKAGKSGIKKASKSAKAQLDKMNSNSDVFDEVRELLVGKHEVSKRANVLDVKALREDSRKDEEKKNDQKVVENDIQKQLEMLTGMGL